MITDSILELNGLNFYITRSTDAIGLSFCDCGPGPGTSTFFSSGSFQNANKNTTLILHVRPLGMMVTERTLNERLCII